MKKLRWRQRVAIQTGIEEGKTNAQIAREIGVHRATVGREIARNAKNREHYRAQQADLASWERQKEAMPKRFLLTFNGVELLSALSKRNQIYTYLSRTHLNALSRAFAGTTAEWNPLYERYSKMQRYMPAPFYLRMKIFDFRLNGDRVSNAGDLRQQNVQMPSRLPVHRLPGDTAYPSAPLCSTSKPYPPLLVFSTNKPLNGRVAASSFWKNSFFSTESYSVRPVVSQRQSPAVVLLTHEASCFQSKNPSPYRFSLLLKKLSAVA